MYTLFNQKDVWSIQIHLYLRPGILNHCVKHKYSAIAAPKPLNAADLTFSNFTNSSVIIHISKATSTLVDDYFIWIKSYNETVYNETISPVSGDTAVAEKVDNLSAGLRYDLAVKTVLRDISSESSIHRHFYTGEFNRFSNIYVSQFTTLLI